MKWQEWLDGHLNVDSKDALIKYWQDNELLITDKIFIRWNTGGGYYEEIFEELLYNRMLEFNLSVLTEIPVMIDECLLDIDSIEEDIITALPKWFDFHERIKKIFYNYPAYQPVCRIIIYVTYHHILKLLYKRFQIEDKFAAQLYGYPLEHLRWEKIHRKWMFERAKNEKTHSYKGWMWKKKYYFNTCYLLFGNYNEESNRKKLNSVHDPYGLLFILKYKTGIVDLKKLVAGFEDFRTHLEYVDWLHGEFGMDNDSLKVHTTNTSFKTTPPAKCLYCRRYPCQCANEDIL